MDMEKPTLEDVTETKSHTVGFCLTCCSPADSEVI